MRILIFSNYQHGGTGVLLKAIKELGHESAVTNSLTQAKIIEADWGGVDIVIPRFAHHSFADSLSVAEYFSGSGSLLAISPGGMRDSADKFTSYEMLYAAAIPTPQTELILDHGEPLARTLDFPLVLKPVDESRGRGIKVVHDAIAFKQAVTKLAGAYPRVIAQTYIQESVACDIRAFVAGDAVVAAMERRGAPGSFVSNLAQGGTAKPVDISEHESKMAIAAAQLFGALYGGVDIIRTNQGPMVLEVNVSPGFKAAEITGVPIAKLVIEELVRRRKADD